MNPPPDPLRLPELPAGSTVAVAMSGGVDSSVAAALCVAGGHRVFGVMLRLWAEPGAEAPNRCCTLGAIDDARAVANALDIPFQVLDAASVFKREVVDAFTAAAAAGDTPNPCFTCNRRIRFAWLLEHARALGADCLATGHYARVDVDPAGGHRLRRGVDADKDQSYVLHRLSQAQLARAVFPLGVYTKPEVRALAAAFGLSVAARPDSVDLCWTGPDGVAGFLGRHLPADALRPGAIVDADGRTLGRHHGLPRYTVGQRRGLGVAVGSPVYVVARDPVRNALVVGPDAMLGKRRVAVRDMHWLTGAPPAAPMRVAAQVRYRSPAAPALLLPGPGLTAEAVFDAPQRAPAPGQGLVAYVDDAVIGGGVIAAVA
ncbi:tRNA 2-thiouridine(34) synthase MnmA [bacterium]|nr:tRNA 2-thiouridine(34) synthase MnmA [Chloroflexi bacterium CFX6]RIL09345.1 MAG: tRNA 2-thiouridine(34) synthase MnmA [bacterium]